MNPEGGRNKVFSGVFEGMRLAWFTGKTLFSLAKHNQNIKVLNALCNPSIKRTNRDCLTITDTQWILEINGAVVSSSAPSSVGAGTYMLMSVHGDYLTCRTYDGVNIGPTDIYIAKHYKLRNSISSEVKLGTRYDYSYAPSADQNNVVRTSTQHGSTSNVEQEMVTPVWIVGDELSAISATTTVSDPTGNRIGLMMIDDRKWTKIPVPS